MKVGIFWWYKRARLILDSSRLEDGERTAQFVNHRRGHLEYWSSLQTSGIISDGIEYEEFPRGRVVFDTNLDKFFLFADRCILKNPALVAKIIVGLELPTDRTSCETDEHYRCYKCLGFEKTI